MRDGRRTVVHFDGEWIPGVRGTSQYVHASVAFTSPSFQLTCSRTYHTVLYRKPTLDHAVFERLMF